MNAATPVVCRIVRERIGVTHSETGVAYCCITATCPGRHRSDQPEAERIEVWFQDEAGAGEKGRMVRRWFQRGMRQRMVKDQRYRSAYIFGSVCPARDPGPALMLTAASVAAMNLLLKEVASQLPPGTYAAMLIDNIILPPREQPASAAEDPPRPPATLLA